MIAKTNLWGEPAYYTSLEGSLAIMQVIQRMQFEKRALEWFQSHAPLVVEELRRNGVQFPGMEIEMGKYAEGTSVPVERSQTEINRVLAKFGADQFAQASSSQPPAVLIGFRAKGKLIKFHLPMPDGKEFRGTPIQIEKQFQAECRRRWRALLLVLKAKLEAVDSGITTFEQEFYAHMVLPGGMTVYEMTHDHVDRSLESGKPPSFTGLLGFDSGKK